MSVKYLAFPAKRAYGVELEICTTGVTKKGISSAIQKVDSLHDVRIYSGWTVNTDNEEWYVKDDSSCGFEISSYKSKGVKDLVNISKVSEAVSKIGAKVDEKCGYHIHVEVEDFSYEQVSNLVATWMKVEHVIANVLPEHRVNNKYCKFLNEYHKKFKDSDIRSLGASVFWDKIKPNVYGNFHSQRRVSLNIWNYAGYESGVTDRLTVEFRFPEGTLNSEDVKNWIRLLVNFVEITKDRSFVGSTKKVNLDGALMLLGLSGLGDEFLILSNGMRDTKEWFLRRVLKYSKSKRLCKSAVTSLNDMFSPHSCYELSEDCGACIELR